MINTVPITPGKLAPCLESLWHLKMPALSAWRARYRQIEHYTRFRRRTRFAFASRAALANRGRRPARFARPRPRNPPHGLVYARIFANRGRYRPRDSVSGRTLGAEPRLQVAAYQLILIGASAIIICRDGWWVVGAGNDPDDGAVALIWERRSPTVWCISNSCPKRAEWIKWGQRTRHFARSFDFYSGQTRFSRRQPGPTNRRTTYRPDAAFSGSASAEFWRLEKERSAREFFVAGIVGEAA